MRHSCSALLNTALPLHKLVSICHSNRHEHFSTLPHLFFFWLRLALYLCVSFPDLHQHFCHPCGRRIYSFTPLSKPTHHLPPFPLLLPLQDRLDHLTNHVMDVSQRTHDRTHLMSFVLRFYTLTVTSQATSVPTLVRHDPKSNIYRTCLCFYDPPPTLVLKALPPPTTHSIGDLDVLHSPYKDFSWYST
jgi:hypothetical protein